jgi:hypothetical protein
MLEGNPADSVGRFRRHLRVLESTTPAASSLASQPDGSRHMPKAWAEEASRLRRLRRKQAIARNLLAVMGSTLVVGLIPGLHAVLAAHVIADIVFVFYACMLVRARGLETEQRMRRQFEAEVAHRVEPETADLSQPRASAL